MTQEEIHRLIVCAKQKANAKDFGNAMDDVEKAFAIDPQNLSIAAVGGGTARAMGDFATALKWFQRAEKIIAAAATEEEGGDGGKFESQLRFVKEGLEFCRKKLLPQQEEEEEESSVPIFSFPRTRHILAMGSGGAVTRDDLLMDKRDAEIFFGPRSKSVIVEEKIDGANLGLSWRKGGKIIAQNRSHFVNSASHPQFRMLDQWISDHYSSLHRVLGEGRRILFGEWMYARHSLHYSALPDLFIVFDIFDTKEKAFLSRKRREWWINRCGGDLVSVPLLFEGRLESREQLEALLSRKSQFYEGFVEGVYIRIDDDSDSPVAAAAAAMEEGNEQEEEDWDKIAPRVGVNVQRGKVVREDFIQGITGHWMGQTLTKNIVKR